MVSEASEDGFWDLDLVTEELFYNVNLAKVLGISIENAKTYIYNLENYAHPEDMVLLTKTIDQITLGKRDTFSVEYRTCSVSGKYRWILAKGKVLKNSNGEPIRISGFHIDIENRKIQEEQIKTLAYFDNTTKLPNRAMFYEIMKNTLKCAREEQQQGFVLYMDIDNFKIINDTFGHEFGDIILGRVANRLKTLENIPKRVFRLSGDEFIIILPKYSEQNTKEIANKVQDIMIKPFIVDENEIQISMSIGLALYPNDATSADELLRKADLAMYKAKEFGKNQYQLYETSFDDEITDRLLLENHLRNALHRGEFVLNYQPQIDTLTENIIGFEALIRWFSPEYGFVSPMVFIPIAEEMGLINKIGEWILKDACEFSLKINKRYKQDIIISINISPIQLNQDNFIDIVQRVIETTGVDTKLIGIEITETSLMTNFEDNSKKLEQLRELGITIALDDFGTGYSSLNYLMMLPIHIIKIDRSFIVNMIHVEKGINIIESIINLAHSMGLRVVAEGVELAEQLDVLKHLKCDQIQGYIFGKPISEQDTMKYIEHKMAQTL